ncbi:MAG TPA: hypothetical protein VK475_04910, partial [Pyrinomonadaceae bacterium]|nr:hypothetical protein [Pyrinomonadaceae bacterium]
AASAQPSSCTLKIDQLPESAELRGFRVGMTFDQAKARVPQVRQARPDEFGVAKISINPSYDPSFDRTTFADVRTISLDFLDGRLVSLWIGYESSFKWQTLDAFVLGFSKALNLPSEWQSKRGTRQLSCNGFTVLASTIAGSPSVRISEDAAQETIATRREEAAAAAEAAEAMVIGDQQTKLYYPSDCSAVSGVKESNRVKFKDKDAAEKAGFKLAKDCQ